MAVNAPLTATLLLVPVEELYLVPLPFQACLVWHTCSCSHTHAQPSLDGHPSSWSCGDKAESFTRWASPCLTPHQNSTGVVVTSCVCTRMSTHTHTHTHSQESLWVCLPWCTESQWTCLADQNSVPSGQWPGPALTALTAYHTGLWLFLCLYVCVCVCVCVGIYGQRNFKTYLITFIFYDKNDSILKWYCNKAPFITDGRIGFLSYLQKEHWGCGGGKGWEFGVSRYQLLHLGWINNMVLLCAIGNYLQYPEINHNGKNIKK